MTRRQIGESGQRSPAPNHLQVVNVAVTHGHEPIRRLLEVAAVSCLLSQIQIEVAQFMSRHDRSACSPFGGNCSNRRSPRPSPGRSFQWRRSLLSCLQRPLFRNCLQLAMFAPGSCAAAPVRFRLYRLFAGLPVDLSPALDSADAPTMLSVSCCHGRRRADGFDDPRARGAHTPLSGQFASPFGVWNPQAFIMPR